MAGTRSNTAKVVFSLLSNYVNTASGAGATNVPAKTAQEGYTESVDMATGTGAGQSQRVWTSVDRALSSAATEDIDVYDFGSLDIGGGAGLDSLGQSLALSGVKGILIKSASTSVGNLLVGGKGTAAAWSDPFNGDDDAVLKVVPDGAILLYAPTAAGYDVTDTSNHLLQLEASGGAVTYTITLIGI